MSEWQAIETAPRDGTVILLGNKHFPGVAAGYWNLARGVYGPDEEHPWTFLQSSAVGQFGGLNGHTERAFTHWMPLPEPPK